MISRDGTKKWRVCAAFVFLDTMPSLDIFFENPIHYVMRTFFAVMIACVASPVFSAPPVIMPTDRETVLRRFFPATDDRELQRILDDDSLILYTDREMPPVYQLAALGSGGPEVAVYSTSMPIAANPDATAAALGLHPRLGNGNREFPWDSAAGMQFVAQGREIRFVLLPRRDDGTPWPVVWWAIQSPGNQYPITQWTFPNGTVVGEILIQQGPDGYQYAFEIRTRRKDPGYWITDAYRPFRTAAELRSAIADSDGADELVAHLAAPASLERRRLSDKQPLREVFRQDGYADVLPGCDPELVKRLLTETPFKLATAETWRKDDAGHECFAPTTRAAFHIVPTDYMGGIVRVDIDSCTRCHSTAGTHVEAFARNGTGHNLREWYGTIRGSDGIFSFHPLQIGAVRAGNNRGMIRRDLIESGIVAEYDERKHPQSLYQRLKQYDPELSTANTSRVMGM